MHKGYWHVNIKTGKGRISQKKEPVHKLVLLAFHGAKESPDLQCRHLNGNAIDNHHTNLKWGAAAENAADTIRHGTSICLRLGEEHPRSKLKLEKVINIKSLIDAGFNNVSIAKAVSVKRYTIQDIRSGKSWKHVPHGGINSLKD